MRYRITFLAGLAVGFVIGTRAGRERYEQLKQLASKAKDSPAIQQAAGAAQAQAASLARAAKDRAAHTVGDRIPGMKAREANGHSQSGGTYTTAPGTPGSGGQPGR
jgi:hypothetical protein